jgi:cytochrome c oxidase subunit 1
MKLSTLSPHLPFLLLSAILLLLSIIDIDGVIDIQLHDTYYVIALSHIILLVSIFAGFIGFIYWLLRHKTMIPWITWSHFIGTFLSIFVFIFGNYYLNTLPKERYIEQVYEIKRKTINNIEEAIILSIFVLVAFQILFLINIVFSLIKKQ